MTGFEAASLHIDAVREAAARLAPYVARTPLVRMNMSGLRLKAESLHPTGSFKIRGAFNAILSLSEQQRRCGVVAHSSGNHAQAVAYAAARLGVRAVIVMPSDAPPIKADETRRWGAEIVIVGTASAERAAAANSLATERALVPVPPYDAWSIIEATGTIALEILESAPGVSYVFAPLSGGGLMAGLAAALKQLKETIQVIGVEPEVAADALASFEAGHIVSFPSERMAETIADGLRVQQLGTLTWPLIRDNVDDIVTVSEDAIRVAMRRIASEARLISEPSGAVAAAGALRLGKDGSRTVAILSGGNVDLPNFTALIAPDR